MILRNDYNVLIISGLWNKYLFQQDWVGKYLLPDEELNVEFPINMEASSHRVSNKSIRICVQGNRLLLTPIRSIDDNFAMIQDISLKIADYLPHTPVNSYGINFLFDNVQMPKYNDIIEPKDSKKISEYG